MKRTLTVTAAAALGLLVPGAALAAHGGSVYTATLSELNGSGAGGTATVELNDDASQATITISPTGQAEGLPHAQHIHGEIGTANQCPTPDADGDGDGVITVAEGLPSYGGIQVSLTTSGDTSADSGLAVDRYPVGNESYSRTIDISEEVSGDLANLHIVVHGVDENGNGEYDGEARSSLDDSLPREATLPASCGQLALTSAGSGGVATGAGGATDTSSSTPLVALGLAGAAVAGGLGLRRSGESA